MRGFWRGRNLIRLSCLLALAACVTTPRTPTTSDAAATVTEAESVAPAVSSIVFRGSPARDDTYGLGETVEVRVRFDSPVTATGKPRMALTIGTQTRHATLSSWSRQSLYFTYTVQEDDRDEDGISIAPNALALNGGTIKSADATIDADLTHGPVAAERRRKVNGSDSSPPGVRDIAFNSSPARGDTFGLGETVEVRVEFDRAVKATGSPQVVLTIGERMRHATLSAWSPQSMHFEYTVQGPDRDEDGISIAANALALNEGTIKQAGDRTTDADLSHGAVAANPTRKVDGSLVTRPVVRAIYLDNHIPPPTGDTYVRGERVRVWVEFDRDVTVTGQPLVALTIGSQTRQAIYSGHSAFTLPGAVGTFVDEHVLSFDYLVQSTDRDEDGISIPANAVALNGGTISHAAAPKVDADLAHNSVPADPGRKVDGSRVTP